MEDTNRDESVCSVDKKPIVLEHNYRTANLTCDAIDNKHHVFGRKFTRHAVEKWTDSTLGHVRTCDDWNKIIDRETAIHKVHYPFLPEQQIRGKVCKKFGIPAVMGDVLSRTSPIFDGIISSNLLKSRKKNLEKMPLAVAKPEELSEMTSQEKRGSETQRESSYTRRNAIDDSGMISNESELSQSVTPDFEFPRNIPIQSRPAQYLTPIYPSPATERMVTPDATSSTSIHSQPTQVLTKNCELPDFRQAFGSMAPSNFSNPSPPPPSLTRNDPLSNTQGTIGSCLSENESCPSELTPYLPLSPTSFTPNVTLSDTRQGVIKLKTHHENSNSDDSDVTRSIATNLELSDIQQVIDSEIDYEKTPNGSELTESTVSTLELLDTQRDIDTEDLTTQNCSPIYQDLNENLIAKNVQTPRRLLGRKRKREEEQESLWTDMEEYSESGSPILEMMNSSVSLLSNVVKNPCNISIGTNISIPAFFARRTQNRDTVNLDHCYSEQTNKSSAGFRTRELDASAAESDGHAVNNVSDNNAGNVKVFKEFSGSDTSNIRKFEQRQVTKIKKRKIVSCEHKENSPVTKSRRFDDLLQRSTFDSDKNLNSRARRLNLNDPRKSDGTETREFPNELLSNHCCEYDHGFQNISNVELSPCVPMVLKLLVEPSYAVIKQHIDEVVRCLEILDEDL